MSDTRTRAGLDRAAVLHPFTNLKQFASGERNGKFRLGADEVVADASGKSAISYDDHAIAVVDEVEQNRHVRRRFTVGY